MTDGIGRLSGYGNYGVGGYVPQRRSNAAGEENTKGEVVKDNREETPVDPSKVMDFLANNNYFVGITPAAEAGEVDAATQDRVAGYMEQFEMIYGIVQEEFGEELAPAVMDVVMDRLIGMTE